MNKPSWMRVGISVCAEQELLKFRDSKKNESGKVNMLKSSARKGSKKFKSSRYGGKAGITIASQPFERLPYPSGETGCFGIKEGQKRLH